MRFFRDVGALLWPAPATLEVVPRRSPTPPESSTEFLLLAGAGRPRLLVPLSSRRAAAAAVRRYGEHSGVRARVVNTLLQAAVQSGAASRLPFDHVRVHRAVPVEDIESHLAEVFGAPVLISLHLSGARANRKPVVQVLDSSGATLGFVKIGIDTLTRALVDHEARALTALSAVSRQLLVVPEVLSHHVWRGLSVLVLAPLHVDQARAQDKGQRVRALAELSQGRTVAQELPESIWWRELRDRIEQLSDRAVGRRLAEAARAFESCATGLTVQFGPAHGDWTSWNTAVTRKGVLAWDWERYATGVPLGYDQLHFDLQERTVGRGEERGAAARTLCRTATSILGDLGPQRDVAHLVAAAYLIDISCRYLTERQEEAGAAAGRVEDWLLPALEEQLGAVAQAMMGGTRADR